MEVRRIGPDGGFLREFTDVRKRVQHLETRPSGVIATRDMFIVTDPVTGVKTIMGTLPDGTTGFQPFVGDVVPPPVATVPLASTQPGMMTVTWDGGFVDGAEKPSDFVHLNVMAHKIVNGSTILTLEAGTIRLPFDSLIINTDIISYGEQWQFSFESEDYNGNISARSARSAVLDVLSNVDDTQVGEALAALEASTQAAQDAADTAQVAADAAQQDADAAAASALSAANLAGSKGVVYTQSATPSADYSGLWIDTAHNNIPRRFLGVRSALVMNLGGGAGIGTRLSSLGWSVSAITTTPSLADASKYDLVAMDAGYAGILTAARDLATQLWSRGVSLYTTGNDTTAMPPLYTGAPNRGTTKNVIRYVSNGSTGPSAYSDYADADLNLYLSGINSSAKITGVTLATATGTDQPINLVMEHPTTFARWAHVQTYGTPYDVVNAHLSWISNNWVAIQDQGIIDAAAAAGAAQAKADTAFNNAASAATAAGTAQTTADGKNRNWYQPDQPAGTGHKVGDVWFDTDDNYKQRTWTGTVWQLTQDSWGAQTTADSKGITYTQSVTPPVSARLPQNLWNDTSLGLNNIVVKYWDGNAWTALADKVATDAAAVAATKTKTYFQTAQPALTGNTLGDLWFDTDDSNKPYVWNGSAWIVAQDATIAKSIFGTFSTDIDQTQPNKWLFTKYDKLGLVTTVAPSYLDIVGLAGTSSVIPDGAQLVVNIADNYIGQLRTIVNIASAKTIAVTATHDDGAQIYVDGVSVYSKNTYTAGSAISFSISAGWHVIDLLWMEAAGGDGWSNVSPTFGSQFTSMFAPVSLTSVSQAVSAAQTSANTAISSQSYSTNASFDDWTGTFPTGYGNWNSTPIKETSIVRRAPNAIRFNVADATAQSGVAYGSILSHAPNIEYYTVELEFQLVSGTLAQSGFLLDWNGMANNRAQFSLANEVTNPITGKWYRIVKTLRRPTNATGTWTNMSGYLMGQYSGFGGTGAAKNIVFDWMNVRPATTEEITAYGTPASIQVVTDLANSKGEVIYSDTEPAVGKRLSQNLWVDTTGGLNLHKRWNGSGWVVVADSRIAQSVTDISALTSQVSAVSAQADRSITTFYGSTTPTTPESGDLWLTGVAGEPMKRYNGSAWITFEDPNVQQAYTKAGDAQAAADAKVRTFAQDAEPTGMVPNDVGDLWIDTNDNNKLWRYSGSAWVAVQDAGIAAAQGTANTALSTANTAVTAAQGAQATADGKNTNYYQPNQPTGGTYKIGDTWFDTDDNYKMRTFAGGTTWQLTQDSAGAITTAASDATTKANNAQAAAITAAAIDATNKADAAKAAALTAVQNAENKVVNGSFELDFDAWTKTAATTQGIDTAVSRSGTKSYYTTGVGEITQAGFPVVVGSVWRYEGFYKTDSNYVTGSAGGLRLQKSSDNGTSWTDAVATNLTVNTNWTFQSAEYTVPAGVTHLRARLAFAYTVGPKAWFDDVRLIDVTQIKTLEADAQTKATAAKDAAIAAAAADATVKANAAQTAATTAAATDAAAKAAAAQQAAIDAAAADAAAKAAQAQQAAITAAAADAQTKANAAQQAAIDAAAVTAQLKADGAEQAAIDAAAADAATKAAAAQQAAIDAAALDASAKATQAKTDAITAAATDAQTRATQAKLDAQAAAALDATAKADAAQMAAIQSQAYSLNPSFEDWTGTYPNYFGAFNAAPTKETTTVRTGKYAVRFNSPDTTTQRGITSGSILAHAPNLDYITLELDVRLDSGSSFGGSGVLIDWTGMTGGNRVTVSLASEIPAPVTGKWYRVTKVIRRPATATGTLTGYNVWLMGQYNAGLGTQAIKNVIFDWFNIRPSTTEEITAYGTPASIQTLTDTVNTKTKSWFQPSAPPITGNTTGDLWFDTDDSNKVYIWNGAWTVASDQRIESLNTSVTAVQATANGKNKILYSTSAASGTTGYIAGDTWFQRDVSNNIIGQWEFTTSWQARKVDDAMIANLNAAKIIAGTLDAQRIGANTIGASKLIISDMEELIPNPFFHPSGEPVINGTVVSTASTAVSAGAPFPYAYQTIMRDNHPFATPNIAVQQGDQFYLEVWVATATAIRNFNLYMFGSSTPSGGLSAKVSAGNVAPTSTWTKVTMDYTVPAGFNYIKPVLQVNTAGGETAAQLAWYATGWSMKRKNTGKLIVDGAIQANSAIIANGAIGNAHIGDAAIDTAEIKDLAVKTAKIDDLAITNAKIANATIQAAKIGSVDAGTITVGYLSGNQIAATAIDGKTITGPTIQTDSTPISAARGIKLTSNELAGWDATGQKNFSLTTAGALSIRGAIESGSTIKGATLTGSGIETTTAASRGVKITSNGVSAYDTSGNLTFKVDGTTGVVEAPGIKANSISGDKITSGTIVTGHMSSGTIDGAVISAGSLEATKLKAKSIGVDRLTVSSSDNLIVEAAFEHPTNPGSSWTTGANRIIQPTGGRGGAAALRITGTTSSVTTFNLNNKIQVDDDSRFRVSLWLKTNTPFASGNIALGVRTYAGAGLGSDMVLFSNTSSAVTAAYVPGTDVWTQIEGVSLPLPSGTTALEFFLRTTAPATSAYVDIDSVSVTRAAEGKLIVDGSITAEKLETDLVLATRIVAGDPAGTHAEMSPQGFRVYADAVEPGAPSTEVVRLGVSSTNDYFAITKADGTMAAAISQDGVGAFSAVNAIDSLVYRGTELQNIIDVRGTGVVAAAYRTTNPTVNATVGGGWVPYLRLEVTMLPGRLYKIWTSAVRLDTTGDAGCTLALGFKTNAVATTDNCVIFTQGYKKGAGRQSVTLQEFFAIQESVPTTVSIIMFFGVQEGTTGVGAIRADLYTPVRLTIEDMGTPAGVANGTHLDSAVTPPAPKNTYVTQFAANNMRSYDGSNNWYQFNTSQLHQGLSPAGYGNLKGIATFPDMTAALSGATINYIRVYFKFNHWYYNSGGTARIGLHTFSAVPATFSQSGTVATSSGWPKPGARWVDIPSAHWANFKNGTYKGVSLEGDGTYETYGYADAPTIEISYTK